MDEIFAQNFRPKFSSSAPNDLSYIFLNLIFKHTQYSDLMLNLLSDVLSKSLWQETSICLLSKKKEGYLTSLKNWRQIILINYDARIFSSLLNTRLVSLIYPLISPNQSGFMKECSIIDNGALAQIARKQASIRDFVELGLLHDQE